jgi:rubredoxin
VQTFEGSYRGDKSRLDDDARLARKVCWHVYGPQGGGDCWQIPAGTPFARRPDEWRRRLCDGAKEHFRVILDDR